MSDFPDQIHGDDWVLDVTLTSDTDGTPLDLTAPDVSVSATARDGDGNEYHWSVLGVSTAITGIDPTLGMCRLHMPNATTQAVTVGIYTMDVQVVRSVSWASDPFITSTPAGTFRVAEDITP